MKQFCLTSATWHIYSLNAARTPNAATHHPEPRCVKRVSFFIIDRHTEVSLYWCHCQESITGHSRSWVRVLGAMTHAEQCHLYKDVVCLVLHNWAKAKESDSVTEEQQIIEVEASALRYGE